MSIKYEIERLIHYALMHKLIEADDVIYIRNHYLHLFAQTETKKYTIDETLEYPDKILNNMYEYIQENPNLNLGSIENMIKCKIMDVLTPRPSEVIYKFKQAYINYGIKQALQYFYELSIASNYIKMEAIAKNQRWIANTRYGDLEISINLAKPEKDPKEIELAKLQPSANYPKCVLCIENEGFAGSYTQEARFTHRIIPICLNGETWYFQFSPYVYYHHHAIIINHKHKDMLINKNTFKALFDFVDFAPDYIIGANADIPIVGGSILSHDHFQAGLYEFPIDKAQIRYHINFSRFPNIQGAILNWPLTAIRLRGNKTDILALSESILHNWSSYNDDNVDIISHTANNKHNSITPILRKIGGDNYQIYLLLRNNRCNDQHPDGIFHSHKHLHHIKKENIGLIEAMGLAILPGRLAAELEQISQILLTNKRNDIMAIDQKNSLYQHKDFMLALHDNKKPFDSSTIEDILKKAVGDKFTEVLDCCGIFKNDDKGNNALQLFTQIIDAKISLAS